MMVKSFLRKSLAGMIALALILPALVMPVRSPVRAAGAGTPISTYSCDLLPPSAGTPASDAGHMTDGGATMTGMEIEFDQLYIDMMIPHHASIVALAEVALPRLTDERLRQIASDIVATQSAEIDELRRYRTEFFGSPEPSPMDASTMEMMNQMMPGMGSMDDMAFEMDAEAQVAAFCEQTNPDLAFIEMTIPHHQMAIVASKTALTQAIHQETQDFAQRVIDAQQREIDELTAIRADLEGVVSPVSG